MADGDIIGNHANPYYSSEKQQMFTGNLLGLLKIPEVQQRFAVPIDNAVVVDDDTGIHKNILEVTAGGRTYRIVADVTDA